MKKDNKKVLISIKGLDKEYKSIFKKEKLSIFEDLNLEINRNENITIVGPNGAGKTTLINIILRLLEPTNGKVTYPFSKTYKNFLKSTGIQFQTAEFPAGYTVDEITDLIFQFNNEQPKNLSTKEWLLKFSNGEKKKLYKLLELEGKENRKATKLSGGEKQRLNVLLALINKPSLLILDEITTGLDLSAQNKITNYIREYTKKKNITLILISHNLNEIELLSDRIVVLDKKKIVSDMTRSEIEKKHKSITNYVNSYFIKGEGK